MRPQIWAAWYRCSKGAAQEPGRQNHQQQPLSCWGGCAAVKAHIAPATPCPELLHGDALPFSEAAQILCAVSVRLPMKVQVAIFWQKLVEPRCLHCLPRWSSDKNDLFQRNAYFCTWRMLTKKCLFSTTCFKNHQEKYTYICLTPSYSVVWKMWYCQFVTWQFLIKTILKGL